MATLTAENADNQIIHLNQLNVDASSNVLTDNSRVYHTAAAMNYYVLNSDAFIHAKPYGIIYADYAATDNQTLGNEPACGWTLLRKICSQNYKYCFAQRTRIDHTNDPIPTFKGSTNQNEFADMGEVYVKRQKK